jgi:hypothetical protein|tara:strand:- start:208 stop:378 length:171 start_codon:yes stop_codon:yes gene_type:complete
MMKKTVNRISALMLEIEKLKKDIKLAESTGKTAFAKRLTLILEKKSKKLKSWVANS